MYSRKHFLRRLMSIEAHSLSENIHLEIKKSRRICNPENYLKAGNMITTNLLLFGRVRIGRGHNKFPKISRRYGLVYCTRTYILTMIDEMVRRGYIDQRLGYGNKLDKGNKTLLIPTNKLIQEFNTITLGEVLLKEEIELRDKKLASQKRGKSIDYSDNEFTLKIRDEVKFINEAIKSVDISLIEESKILAKNFPISLFNGSDIQKDLYLSQPPFLNSSSNSQYYHSSPLEPGQSLPNFEIRNVFNGFRRIFTGGDFAFGGRYHDVGCFSYQSMNKGIRANILIDGEPTVELDFSNMFLMMLYHTEGIDYQSDGYEIDGYERDDVKLAVNIVFNTKNKQGAVGALRNNGISDGGKLIDLIKMKHSRLEKYFYSEIANELMRKESDIATEIITIGISEGIISLPLHDSFIVQKKNENKMEEIMCDVYSRTFNYGPRIKTN